MKNMSNVTKYELPSVRIKSGETASICTAPVSPRGKVAPVGLEIDSDVARHLMVNDFKVGKNSQLASCASIPATLFATSPPVELHCDDVPPGLRFSLQVTCIGLTAVTFRGRLLAESPVDLGSRSRRMWTFGFGHVEVKAGETVDVWAEPQVETCLKRLHVPPHLIDVFRIDALFQGRYLDIEQASRVVDPKQLGRENLSRGGEVSLDPTSVVGVGCPVTVTVTNTTKTTQYFSAALLGTPTRSNPK
jgi:hypothetical protein